MNIIETVCWSNLILCIYIAPFKKRIDLKALCNDDCVDPCFYLYGCLEFRKHSGNQTVFPEDETNFSIECVQEFEVSFKVLEAQLEKIFRYGSARLWSRKAQLKFFWGKLPLNSSFFLTLMQFKSSLRSQFLIILRCPFYKYPDPQTPEVAAKYTKSGRALNVWLACFGQNKTKQNKTWLFVSGEFPVV